MNPGDANWLEVGAVESELVGFLRIIARRRAIDGMRKWQRRKRQDQPLGVEVGTSKGEAIYFEMLADSLSRELLPSSQLRAQEERAWCEELLDQLFPDPTDRSIAEGNLLYEKTPRELAEETGLQPKTVNNRLARIRRVVKMALLT